MHIYSHLNSRNFEPHITQIQVFFMVNFFQLNASLAGKGDRGRGRLKKMGSSRWRRRKHTNPPSFRVMLLGKTLFGYGRHVFLAVTQ
jgi:hypothetical protein